MSKPTLLILILLIGGAIFLIVKNGDESAATKEEIPKKTEGPNDELTKFWQETLSPFINQDIIQQKTRFNVVNKVLEDRGRFIGRLSKDKSMGIKFDPRTESHPITPDIMMMATILDGLPTIIIYLPGIYDVRREIFERGGNEQDFLDAFLVYIIHELDHLALTPHDGSKPLSIEELIAGETKVWAMTCKVAVYVFPTSKNRVIDTTIHSHLSVWQECGQNGESQIWKDYMRKIHTLK